MEEHDVRAPDALCDGPKAEDDGRPVTLTRYQASLIHYALWHHIDRHQGGDAAIQEMVAACEDAQRRLEETWGPEIGVVLA